MVQPTLVRIGEAAAALLAALDDDRRALACRPVDDPRRRDWTYLPRTHPGLSLGDCDTAQRRAAQQLLATTLAPGAFTQAMTVMALEDVLDEREGRRRGRDRLDYAVTLFGDPRGDRPWGWRLEGHHLAVNVAIAEGRGTVTPLFLGANPARVRLRGHEVLAPLAPEEELGRALLEAVHERGAVVDADAPGDLLTRDAAEARADLVPRGVAARDLDAPARALLDELVETYRGRVDASLRGDLDREAVCFAWAGGHAAGQPHYYRLQAPTLLVEYVNSQDGANHVHSVWRDPQRDFGGALPRRA